MADGNGTAPALVVDSVSKSFGAVQAVQEVGFAVEPGSLTCLIGPNGAGKSTLLHCVSGFLRADRGRIQLENRNIVRWGAHRRARAGLATVFQAMRAPQDLDVWSGVMIGCHAWSRTGLLEGILRPPWQLREERRIREEAWRALEEVGLSD
nr:ATP-binding cassette domain-containing protein [Actinomycetota bacterium]